MTNLKAFNTTVLLAALTLLLLVPSGCGGSGSTFELKDLGFTMKLPPGWKQGDARMSGGFRPTSNGIFFYENAEYDDPSGSVMDFPMEGESLTLYVEDLIAETEKMESLQVNLAQTLGEAVGGAAEAELREAESYIRTAVLSKRHLKISGLEAIEVLTRAPRSTIALYIRRADKVIVVTFGAPQQDFQDYENQFRRAGETIRIR